MENKNTELLILPDLKPSKASSTSILPNAQDKNFGAILASPIFSHSTYNPLEDHAGFPCKVYPASEHFSPPPLLTSISTGLTLVGHLYLIPDLLLEMPPVFLFLPLPPWKQFLAVGQGILSKYKSDSVPLLLKSL